MRAADPRRFHWLIGKRRPRIAYRGTDFVDYTLMVLASMLSVYLVYRSSPVLADIGIALCAFLIPAFVVRHGMTLAMPAALRRPQELLYAIVYKLENLLGVYAAAGAILVLENGLIDLTPGLPHHIALMRRVALGFFYLHLAGMTAYRTAILVDHLRKRSLVRAALLESYWRNFGCVRSHITFEILHAYVTGILAHIILLAPWYLLITHVKYSLVLAPFMWVANYQVHKRFMKQLNRWFYRDHWLGHNSELEFLYFHGTHHDAIPSGLIAVGGNGLLEGFFRSALGLPTPFYDPAFACLAYTLDVRADIDAHQFIPGVFPKPGREFRRVGQHSTHHFGMLEPYGFGMKLSQEGLSESFRRVFSRLPEEFTDSIRLDEELTDFEWDNARYRWFLQMCEKYE